MTRKTVWRGFSRMDGKRVAVVGATGGLGVPLCMALAELGADLVLLGRSEQKLSRLRSDLLSAHPAVSVEMMTVDLEETASVLSVADRLSDSPPDVLIHNAGAYQIPRRETDIGVDNVFQINCLSPYLLTERLMPALSAKGARVIAVGSIAHRYGKIRREDPERRSCRSAAKAYGNAKRHLMLALYERFEKETAVTLSVVHPGITLTNITAHYPPWLYTVIKPLMKVLFMPAEKAMLCLLSGVYAPCGYGEWIGPRIGQIWGLPKKHKLHSFTRDEASAARAAVEARLPLALCRKM